jgi:hypothetical protein
MIARLYIGYIRIVKDFYNCRRLSWFVAQTGYKIYKSENTELLLRISVMIF